MPKLETSQDFFNKLFYEYFKDCVIIVGYSGSTKCLLIAKNRGSHYTTIVCFEENENENEILTYWLSFRLENSPALFDDPLVKSGFTAKYEFIYNGQNIKDFEEDEKITKIYIPVDSNNNMSEEGKKAADKFGEYFKKWICDKLNKNSSDWKLTTIGGGNEYFPGLANAMLKQGYTVSDDISGRLFGRFGDVITN